MTRGQIAAATAAAVVVAALAATPFRGTDHSGHALGATGPQGATSTLCYYPDSGAVSACSPAPSWLLNHPEALNGNQQPLPFQAFGHQWMPQPVSRVVPAPGTAGCGGEPTGGVYTTGCEPTDLTWQDTAAPNVVLHPDGTIETVSAQDPSSAADKLLVARQALQASTLYVSWKKANPNEATAVDGYWTAAVSPPPTVATAFGKAYLAEAEAYHYAHGDHGP